MFDRRGNRKYLNEAERQAYFDAVQAEPDKARQAFCLTLFYTGCRISEALNLTASCVDFSQKCAVFETLKRRRRGLFRSVPIPGSLAVLLREITSKNESSARIWQFSRPTAYRLVKERMERAKIEGGMASPKGLRHGFAVACISKEISLPTIQKWLGHARLETTAIYLNVSGDEERKFASRLWTDQRSRDTKA
ncbi:MAG: integrase [Verrucomicrobiales bacterium]|nr:integrase [Verrucomicrobiales bacterium]